MAQHDRDTAAESHDASETTSGDAWTTTKVDRPAEPERPEGQAIPAPAAEPAKQRRRNWHRFTLLAATLGLLATAGAIAAYRFRDKHEKLGAFATVVDETFARPEKLVSALRDNVVKWTGKATKPVEPAKTPARMDIGKVEAPPVPKPAPVEAKPPEPAPPPRSNGDHITWAAPGSTPAPAPSPSPSPAPAPVASPPTPAKPSAETKAQVAPPQIAPAQIAPTQVAPSSEQTEALVRRVEELERIAREALALAEQTRSGAAAAAAEAPRPNAKIQDVEDNVAGLEGRIDWLSDRLAELNEKLEAPKGETRVAREAAEPAPPPPVAAAEPVKGPNPANILVVANSLQRALDRGAPYVSEHAALVAQGADPEALAALAPSAEKGAPNARALRASFHSLSRKLEESAEPKPDAPLADRLLHGASKLVKVRTATEKEKASIGDTASKVEAALDRGDIEAALATFAELPDDAKAVAREWEEAARRRIDAEKAAASILSSALDALAKSKN